MLNTALFFGIWSSKCSKNHVLTCSFCTMGRDICSSRTSKHTPPAVYVILLSVRSRRCKLQARPIALLGMTTSLPSLRETVLLAGSASSAGSSSLVVPQTPQLSAQDRTCSELLCATLQLDKHLHSRSRSSNQGATWQLRSEIKAITCTLRVCIADNALQ